MQYSPGKAYIVEEALRMFPEDKEEIEGLDMQIFLSFRSVLRGKLKALRKEFAGPPGVVRVETRWSPWMPFGIQVHLLADRLDRNQFKMFMNKVLITSSLR